MFHVLLVASNYSAYTGRTSGYVVGSAFQSSNCEFYRSTHPVTRKFPGQESALIYMHVLRTPMHIGR